MEIRAGRFGIYADGRWIGMHIFLSRVLYTKLYGVKLRTIFSPESGITIFSGTSPAARMSGEVMEYAGEDYTISWTSSGTGSMPCIIRTGDNSIVAVRKENGCIEINDGSDPVLIAFSLISLWLSKPLPANGSSSRAGTAFMLSQDKSSWLSIAAPLTIGIGTALFILLIQVYNTPPISIAVIVAYVALLFTVNAVLIVLSLLSGPSIYLTGKKRVE